MQRVVLRGPAERRLAAGGQARGGLRRAAVDGEVLAARLRRRALRTLVRVRLDETLRGACRRWRAGTDAARAEASARLTLPQVHEREAALHGKERALRLQAESQRSHFLVVHMPGPSMGRQKS